MSITERANEMKKIDDKDIETLIEIYNEFGKKELYSQLKEKYGIKNPTCILKRMKKNPDHVYDQSRDKFEDNIASEDIFMSMEELCSPVVLKHEEVRPAVDQRPAAMEKLIHELIGDRLLELTKYITIDSVSKSIIIDQTSLRNDGYNVITH